MPPVALMLLAALTVAESKKLTGTWEVESATLFGKPFPAGDPPVKYEFQGQIITVVPAKAVWIVTLDVSTEPKRMTMTEAELMNGIPVQKAGGQVARTVYALDGDKLTMIQWRGPDPEFPKSLEPKAGEPVLVLVLKRVKN